LQIESVTEDGATQSAGYDVLGLWAFLTLSHGEFHLLTFCQSFETAVLNGAVVNEYVRAIGLRNEAEAF
jgi:hypothetical protein